MWLAAYNLLSFRIRQAQHEPVNTMICPKCNLEQPDGQEQCLRCMVIFAKFHKAQSKVTNQSTVFAAHEEEQPVQAEKDTPVEMSKSAVAGYLIVWLGLFSSIITFWKYITDSDVSETSE
jgi:ribosomal protein L40E